MIKSSNARLYSKMQVSIATLLGSPIAGAALMSMNYRALQLGGRAWQSLAIGGGATAFLVLLAFLLPENSPNFILSIASIIAVQEWYKRSQEEVFKRHIDGGGEKGSWWTTIGVSLLFFIVVMVGIAGVVLMLPESALQ